ncbi:mechanosensitive ion channel family protein [Piscinibacter sp. HJYY11]|uniref:mechanosensitive ion channel family protein n=1 Tax=Piscinibacter sp. HJYY11 TaxID=2801333 RepID=UPI00191D1E1A|nr:mechanosensitive ion channel domain-containing protein [Piscinibacter sp. HJYY11]MBL0726338.1 mechanosensitive ion channel [Piscinibacter sp. HJYY11]
MRIPDWLASWRDYDFELFTLGAATFTVSSLLKVTVFLVALFWIAGAMRSWLIRRALTHTHLDEGTRQAFGSMLRYLVLIVGFVLILQNAGVNLTALSVVAGALGVGVGFGLQNVFSNFVSGVIIMVERPIKVGDRVEMGTIEGTVRDIGARRTMIVTHDNIAILVPNQKFITDQVTNLVYAAAPIRLRIPVHVTLASDPHVVEQALLDAALAHPQVLKEPGPEVLRPTLAAASMSFELCVWHDAHGPVRRHLTSELNRLIDERVRAAGVQYAA